MKRIFLIVGLFGLANLTSSSVIAEEVPISFGTMVRVNDARDPDLPVSLFPRADTDSLGRVYAVWTEGGAPFIPPSEAFLDHSDARGVFGEDLEFGRNLDANRHTPEIAIGPNDFIYLTWEEESTIFVGRSRDGGRSLDVIVPVGGRDIQLGIIVSFRPKIEVGPDGTIHVIWTANTEFRTLKVYYTRSIAPNRMEFETPLSISGESFGLAEAIGEGPEGNVYLLWTRSDLGRINLYLSRLRPSESSFDDPVRVNELPEVATQESDLEISSDGDVFVVWIGFIGFDRNVFFSRSDNRGESFSPNLNLGDEVPGAFSPSVGLVTDGPRNIVVSWSRSGALLFAFSTNDGESFEVFQNLITRPEEAFDTLHDLAMDNRGNLHLVWSRIRNVRFSQGDILYAKGQIAPTLPDLILREIKPVQVTFDTDINGDQKLDMVLENQMAVRALIDIQGATLLDPAEDIELLLEFEGQESILITRKPGQLLTDLADFFLTPRQVGDRLVRITIDPRNLIQELDETNNQLSLTVEVKDTKGFTVFYQDVERSGVRTQFFDETVLQGHDYLQATYPVAPEETPFFAMPGVYKSTGIAVPVFHTGMRRDQNNIWNMAKREAARLGISGGVRAVGIVPAGYFIGYGFASDVHGNTYCVGDPLTGVPVACGGASLVEDGYWTGVAHEFGHTFNFPDPKPEDPEISTSGFWVQRVIEITPAFGFMKGAPFRSFLDKDEEGKEFYRWPTDINYEHTFRELRTGGEADPQLLLIGGLVFADGTIQITNFDWVSSGSVEISPPGDHSLLLLNADGQVIQEHLFIAASRQFESTHGPVGEDVGIFTLAVLYPEETSSLQITFEDKILVKFDVTATLLHSAIDRIPNSGFVNNPEQRRNALHNKIDALEQQISAGNFKGATEKLTQDIGPTLGRWLVDDYRIENALQYTKPEILELVNELARRLELMSV